MPDRALPSREISLGTPTRDPLTAFVICKVYYHVVARRGGRARYEAEYGGDVADEIWDEDEPSSPSRFLAWWYPVRGRQLDPGTFQALQ